MADDLDRRLNDLGADRLDRGAPPVPERFLRAVARRRWSRRAVRGVGVLAVLGLASVVALRLTSGGTGRSPSKPVLVDRLPGPSPGLPGPPTIAALHAANRSLQGGEPVLPEWPASRGGSPVARDRPMTARDWREWL